MNKPFEKILILSDFDGTFAGKDGRILQRNVEAIRSFQSLGGHFTFSTGRLPSMMTKVYPEFASIVNAPLIMCNGAIIYDANSSTVIDERFFDGAAARADLEDIMSRFPLKLACYTDDGIQQPVNSPWDIVGDRFRKINLSFEDDDTAIACRSYVNENYSDKYLCFRSLRAFAEIVGRQITKGRRIPYMKELFRSFGTDELRIFCIGDFENDIDMLKAADVAFCPSNAIDDVKRICTHVLCDHDKGAIADMIKMIKDGCV